MYNYYIYKFNKLKYYLKFIILYKKLIFYGNETEYFLIRLLQ